MPLDVFDRLYSIITDQKIDTRTLKSVCSSWFALISRDIYEHTHLRIPMQHLEKRSFETILKKKKKNDKDKFSLKTTF